MSEERDNLAAAATAVREEIVRQYRDQEREKCPAGAAFYEETIAPWLIARAAIQASEDRLKADIERLSNAVKEAIAAIESGDDLDQRLCCSGAECGCRGSTNRELLLHELRAALSTDSRDS